MSDLRATRASVADFLFHVTGADDHELQVLRFEGVEAMSELFRFRVELCSKSPEIDAEQMLGAACVLSIIGERGRRVVNGIVRAFDQTGSGANETYYAAEIVPLHWYLTQRRNCRIFHDQTCQDLSVPGIIGQVLRRAGIPDVNFDLRRLNPDAYKPREYVVQYRESDMDFIQRLAEEEGIFFYFEHSTKRHVLVFGDSSAAHRPLDRNLEDAVSPDIAQAALPYRDPDGLIGERESEREYVFNLRARNSVQIGSLVLDDYNFTRPELDLQTNPANAERHTGLHEYDYPGHYGEPEAGQRYAQMRLEAHQCRRRVFELSTTVRHIAPGYRASIDEHPRAAHNAEYLITRVEHSATQMQGMDGEELDSQGTRYEATVRAIPFDVVFRPQRATPKPTVLGSQTAVVVKHKNSDDEIYVDKYGRVKVQFHWDHEQADEDSSMFVRVSQGSAGAGWGMAFWPRVGQEVIVDFLEGDPDRPIVTGRVYNQTHMPPYELPEEKTKSTIKTNSTGDSKRYHEIRFEDKHNKEQLFIRAQRRMDTRVQGSHFHTAGGSLHERVGHEKADGEKEGRYFRTVKDGVELHNESDQFELVDGAHSNTVVKDALDDYRETYRLYADKKIEIGCPNSIVVEAGKSIVLRVDDKNFISISKMGVIIQGREIFMNCGLLPFMLTGPHMLSDTLTSFPEQGEGPLDALPADSGKPGKRGGRSKPRVRPVFPIGPITTPPLEDPPPPLPPVTKTCEIRAIIAWCSHDHPALRSAPEDQVLEVVPRPGRSDRIDLRADAACSCPLHPMWAITRTTSALFKVPRIPTMAVGEETSFDASATTQAPSLSTWQDYLVDEDQAKENALRAIYDVGCKGCDGPTRSLAVHVFNPDVWEWRSSDSWYLEAVGWVKDKSLSALLGVLNAALSLVSPVDIEWEIAEGEARLTGRWAESPGKEVFWKWEAVIEMNPLVAVDNNELRIPFWVFKAIPATRGAAIAIEKWLKDIDVELKTIILDINGRIDVDVRCERKAMHDKKPRCKGGPKGEIEIKIGADFEVKGSDTKIEITGGGKIFSGGEPVLNSDGIGIKNFHITRSAIVLKLKAETPLGKFEDSWKLFDKNELVGPFDWFMKWEDGHEGDPE